MKAHSQAFADQRTILTSLFTQSSGIHTDYGQNQLLCAICTSHVDLKGSLDRHNLTLCVPPLHIQSISIVCHLCVQVQAQGCPVVCMGTSIRSFRRNGAVIASTSPTTRSTQWSIEQHQNVMC